jgi:DNA-binding NarL/FixJ family response regulator
MSIRLFIGDDQAVMRAGLRAMLQDTEIRITGEATSRDDLLEQAMNTSADVLLISSHLLSVQNLDPLPAIRRRSPDAAIVLYVNQRTPAVLSRAIAAGASALVSRSASRAELLEVLQRVAAGEKFWTTADLRRAARAPDHIPTLEVHLTRRETEILKRIADGKTNLQIASELDISFETVKEHVQNALQKIGVSDRTQAAVWAVQVGYI